MNIDRNLKIVIGIFGATLLALAGYKIIPSNSQPSIPSNSQPSIAPSPNSSKPLQNVKVYVWSGVNREPVRDVEVLFSVSDGPPTTKKTGTDGYTSIQIPNGVDVQVTLRKPGFITDTYTINLSVDPGKNKSYELKREPQKPSLTHPSPTPFSSVLTPSFPNTSFVLPLPTASSKPTPFSQQAPFPSGKALKVYQKNYQLSLLDGYTIEIFF